MVGKKTQKIGWTIITFENKRIKKECIDATFDEFDEFEKKNTGKWLFFDIIGEPYDMNINTNVNISEVSESETKESILCFQGKNNPIDLQQETIKMTGSLTDELLNYNGELEICFINGIHPGCNEIEILIPKRDQKIIKNLGFYPCRIKLH